MISPAIRGELDGLTRHPAFGELVRKLGSAPDVTAALSGLNPTAKAVYLVLLWQALRRPLVVVTAGTKQSEALIESIQTFFDLLVSGTDAPKPMLLPALDVLPHQNLAPHSGLVEQRAIGLWRMATDRVPLVIFPVASALYKVRKPSFYRQLALTLRIGEDVPLDDVVAHLASVGYERREPVEMVGEYSLRGGILDVFPAEASRPIRVEFFGDTVDSMRRFDVETQRSVLKVEHATILPLLETPWQAESLPEASMDATNLLPESLLIMDEPEQTRAAAERLWKRLEETPEALTESEKYYWRWGEFESRHDARGRLEIRELGLGAPPVNHFEIQTSTAVPFHGNMPTMVHEAKTISERGGRAMFFASSVGEIERLADIFHEYSVPFQLGLAPSDQTSQYLTERTYMAGAAATYLVKGAISRGAVFSDPPLAIYGADDLFDTSAIVARQPRVSSKMGAFAADIGDLKPGDYVVHTVHGIGRFLGIREIVQGEQTGDYMLLEYAGESKLYVPLTRLDLVQKFRGAGEGAPSLDRMGGASWAKTKTRVKKRMIDMADELLKLYAQRKLAEGFPFSPDSNWQREFEDAFEYTPTKDQLQAVAEIKRDMESPQPMDRLLCGDVGFGKTEVAMRAAFKAMGDGKQVALLAPTTVLAFQHSETFKRRFQPFPIRIEMLSRFRSAKEIKEVIADIALGKVDLVIGTHRILSKDVEFRDLGLLLVDEEQRFGVRHKERLKQLRHDVDVLAMSATPIPRTLHMSLLGLRDMSVIETPPKDRLAVHTVVAHFELGLIKTAIEQELQRGGQVYFVHNRVDSIFMRAASIQEMLPDCRVGVGHGQMGEDALEKVLLGFMRQEFDVFVCTTIVENGLDIPLANTMIIENAQHYGLSELYQLRGRVGRSNRRAYAYLLVPADTELTEVARKRLAALKEFSDLGAGFKIAALDLELRGAGNLLGGEQHGQIADIGFDMYIRMLEETVQELRGEEVPLEIHSTLNLGVDIRIPADYITDEHQRLRAYKRIADAKTPEGVATIVAEFADRYGPPPAAVMTLAEFSQVKSLAERSGVESIDRRHGTANIKFHPESRIDPQRLLDLVTSTAGAKFTPAGVLQVPVGANVLAELGGVLGRLAG